MQSRCHINVEGYIETHGGTPVYGWIIWQSPALLDAEFHRNWMNPSGELSDITPKVDGERAILFLPDQIVKWNGRVVPSRRKVRQRIPLLFRLVAILGQMDEIRAKYLAGQPLSLMDKSRHRNLQVEFSDLALAVSGSWNVNPNQRERSAKDGRAKRKAERQRRKQQRRGNK